MEKIFTPNKWFVLFCTVFIGIFVGLQYVIRERVETAAKQIGEQVFTWDWQDKNICSRARMSKAKIIKLTENDAVIQLSGEQEFSPLERAKPNPAKPETLDHSPCQATLTFYKQQNNWVLGRVELQ
jgi:hypothetical protein